MTKSVFHKRTGKIRVCESMCDTCIFRPGNRMHLAEGQLEAMEAEAVARDTHITCHDTLHPEVAGAVCHGFFARHKMKVWPLRLAAGIGAVLFTPAPDGKGYPVGQPEFGQPE